MKDFKTGAEVKFVANIAKLADIFAISMTENYRDRDSLWAQDMLIIMLRIVAGGSPFVQVLQMPGMCQITSSSLIAIIDNI